MSDNKDEGKYTDLPGNVDEIVVRFPPEASGYLHIGHAKAALLNQRYQLANKGKLVFRFDDTNPEKEKEDFEQVIREDVQLLEIQPDIRSHTSDHFEVMMVKCEDLIKRGLAFVDDTPADVMKSERETRTESKNRNNSVDVNLNLWNEMKKGSEIGKKCCVRAKIDMNSNNGCMRDPTIYRCKEMAHPKTGDKYKVYPTYDFACPIVDSLEGVTHALRTTEYEDRDEQFAWFIKAMGLREVYIVSYARLNMMNTVLSKRKLTWFVDQGIVDGWDDPRMPTVRGILRHGLTVEGLKQFIIAQGSSRSVVFMDWDKIWSFNRKILDATCIRLMAIEEKDCVTLNLDCVDGTIEMPAHPKRTDLPALKVSVGPKILIEQIDGQQMKEGDKVTLMGWGNVIVSKITKDATGKVISIDGKLVLGDKDFKKTLKIAWLKGESHVRAKFIYYEHLLIKSCLGKDDDFKDFINKDNVRIVDFLVSDTFLSEQKKGKIFQFLKRGYFIVDSEYDEKTIPHIGKAKPTQLISIPDGTTDLNIYPLGIQKWKKKIREESAKLGQDVPKGKSKKNESTEKGVEKLHKNYDEIDPSSELGSVLQALEVIGENIRQLKSANSDKKIIQENLKILVLMKERFRSITGEDYVSPPPPKSESKSEKSDKQKIEDNVKSLLELKTESKPTPAPTKNQTNKNESKQKTLKENKKCAPKKETVKTEDKSNVGGSKKQSRLGIEVGKNENLADWYTEVITKSEMIEYYDVSGCYILRPWAFAIWEMIQKYLDDGIKSLGVENVYFPMFVSQSALEKEKTHIEDFAPEVAWVTKSGQSELAEPIAIRPTSETVMYPSFAKWCQSHRSLPIKVNQWCNVVRWEFKNPTPFLRTREFLWQEGHTAHAEKEDAVKEVHQVLDLYTSVYEHLLAVPVIKGKKTEKEKFAGGDFTTTIEGYIGSNGRGIQAATSHHLGQNFSKMFEIIFEDPNEAGKKRYAYQNSWGLTTRSIGVMIMVHSDDKGLVLPPNIAPYQVVIVPCGITATTSEEDKSKLMDECNKLNSLLVSAKIRSKCDLNEHYSPGWKFNHWELKGVPIRIELGPKDLVKKQFVVARRDTGDKVTFNLDNATKEISKLLNDMHTNLFEAAKKNRDDHLAVVTEWESFLSKLDEKCLLIAPFCGEPVCEETIKKNSSKVDQSDSSGPLMGAKSLCIPFDQPKEIDVSMKCINPHCKGNHNFTLFLEDHIKNLYAT
ncbi:bifunctional glutamate/proline--tRNA ligase-like [Panonychus citri]|uniref:bifunctional glutamate/proline--tRNA ligase-like n=1 Tax=Panonychus citri TaxID=50023 RepID=UPI002306E8D7|nr:bifunctional glutamate/proline--tRNA ligase-like [Panonychus citri]